MFGQWLDEDGYLILEVNIITSLLQSTFHSQIGSSGFRWSEQDSSESNTVSVKRSFYYLVRVIYRVSLVKGA